MSRRDPLLRVAASSPCIHDASGIVCFGLLVSDASNARPIDCRTQFE
jgi:hypothetical protein